MIKLENAGLRAPRKISLDSGLHSQKSIRAPVNKMIGLRDLWAPQQKFQGSRAPGTPLLGPWLLFGEQGMLLFSKSKMAEVVLSQSGTELRIQDGGAARTHETWKQTMPAVGFSYVKRERNHCEQMSRRGNGVRNSRNRLCFWPTTQVYGSWNFAYVFRRKLLYFE